MTAPRTAALAGCAVALAATLLVLGGAVLTGPWDGVFLHRDFVTVPDPVWNDAALGRAAGAPRAVPLDAVVTALSTVLPAGLVARGLLVAPLLLAGCGTAVLLRRRGVVAATTGAALAILNPYVAERLLLGQAPTLLGYAVIPWVVLAARSSGPLRRRLLLVLAAAVPAALTPVGSVLAGATALLAARTWRERLLLPLPVLALSVPWILAALDNPGAGADGAGADAFAVRSDGIGGTVGAVLTLGGVWAPGAWLESRQVAWVVLTQVLLVIGALFTWWFGRHRSSGVALAGIAYLVGVGTVLALAGPLQPLWRLLQEVPGVALFRDTHRLLAWPALAVAVLVAVGASTLVRASGARAAAATSVVLVTVAAGALTVPDLPGRMAREAAPVALPSEWDTVVGMVNQDPRPGERVLLLPWQPFRTTAWAGPTPFLDPLPRALVPETLHARDLTVRRDGQRFLVGGEDPPYAAQLAQEQLDTTVLRGLGVRWVIGWRGSPGILPELSVPGPDETMLALDPAHLGSHWVVWDLDDLVGSASGIGALTTSPAGWFPAGPPGDPAEQRPGVEVSRKSGW